MSAHPSVLGINFGSSFASISVIGKEGHADCIANEEGERQIACAISYNGEEIYIGNGAKPQLVKNSKNTITGFRNLLGKKFSDVSNTNSASLTPSAPLISIPSSSEPGYTVDILVPPPKAGGKGSAASKRPTPAQSGTATPASEPTPQQLTLSVSQITSAFLKTLLQSATDFMGASPDDGCVIAAPSSFTDEQREALKKAAEEAGIKVLQIIDESAAVLVGYRAGLVKERGEIGFAPKKGEEEKADKTVVVVDVGETGVEVEVVAVREGNYIHLGGGRDESVGGRELDKVLISHFAKEFTKKTKVALPLPITASSSTNEADLRAQTKLLLAIEHTKRSLSASTGAATCAVESLKEGMDLSASINRMRFDGLAGNVYRKIGAQIKKVVEECGLNLVQVDEVLLAGSSSLLPGLHSSISLLFPESTPVSSSLNPSEAIAIGCALQALHLAQLPSSSTGVMPVSDYLSASKSVLTTSKPIGLVLAGGSPSTDFITLVAADTPLPARRLVALPVAAGVSAVGVELWEGESSIKIDTIAPPPPDEDESEEEESEEVASVVLAGKTYLTGAKVEVKAKKDAQVILEVVVTEGKVELKAWEKGSEQKVTASA